MRKTHVVVGCVLCVVASVCIGLGLIPSSPVGAGTNLIRNGGFETPGGGGNQTPDYWTASTTAPYRSEYPEVHAGSYAAYLHGSSGSYSQTVYIDAASVYLFETYSRARGSGSETTELAIRDSTGTVLDRYRGNATDHGWARRIDYISTPLNAWDAVVTLSVSGGNSTEAWFDDIVLEEKTPSAWCFIAAASYGEEGRGVDTLRAFRDEYLGDDAIGRAFVSAYYGMSPGVAEFIDRHDVLKPVVRLGLTPAVAVSRVAVDATIPVRIGIVAAVLGASVLAWLRLRRRRVVVGL
ncbi:MAG: hypothetical protein JSW71_07670 [Gemmatimonadota bacterium]|nr:MAG: hypothetical protein JSW71_07670 [Gemmatimonadota bacterium]